MTTLIDRQLGTMDPSDEVSRVQPPPSIVPAIGEPLVGDPLVGKPSLGRILVAATAVTSLLFMIAITVTVAAAEHTGWVEGFGVALFSTVWGGPGFGLMIGGSIFLHRQEQWDAQQVTQEKAGSDPGN